MGRLLAGVLAAAALAGCRLDARTVVRPPGPARPGMLVGTEELAGLLGAPDLVLLHVAKERASHEGGHLPGARFLPFQALSVNRDGVAGMFPEEAALRDLFRGLGVGDRSRVVLYDDEVGSFAARGFVALDLLGLGDRAALLDGHLGKWRSEGRPLETAGPPPPAPGRIEAAPDPRVLVDLGGFAALAGLKVRSPGAPYALLDTRPPEEFSGEKAGEEVARPGHVPGTVNLFYRDLVTEGEAPVLRSPAEVRALLARAGAAPGDLVVASCRTGRQASLLYFAARWVGHPVQLYDGSFLEWQSDPARPVER